MSRRGVEKSYDGVRESTRCGAALQQSLSAGNQRGGKIGRIMRFGSGECQGTCVNVDLGQCLRNPSGIGMRNLTGIEQIRVAPRVVWRLDTHAFCETGIHVWT